MNTPKIWPKIGFPTRYKDVPRPTKGPWFDAADKSADCLSGGGIVILIGKRGGGKTFMGHELAKLGAQMPNPLIDGRLPRPAIYRTAMDVFLEIRDTFRKSSSESELELMEMFADASLLVIDELQQRGETPFESQKLTHIIDLRYRRGRPTLLIGNYADKAAFAASVDDSIISRAQELGGVINCDWPSFRIKTP